MPWLPTTIFVILLFLRPRFASGEAWFVVRLVANSSKFLCVGLVADNYGYRSALSKSGAWSIQADGVFFDNGRAKKLDGVEALSSGSWITIKINMDEKCAVFCVDDRVIKTCQIDADRVCPAASFGGSAQVLSIAKIPVTGKTNEEDDAVCRSALFLLLSIYC